MRLIACDVIASNARAAPATRNQLVTQNSVPVEVAFQNDFPAIYVFATNFWLLTVLMLRPDLVQAAFPTSQPHPQCGNKKEADGLSTAVHSLKDSEPLYYNSLVDEHTKRHLTKPSVKQHLEKHGFIAKDGTVYPTQQEQIEANRANRLLEEKEAILQKVEGRERARMERLRQMARAGDIVFTKDGIVETKPCGLCNSYHKVGSLLSPTEPCPGSQLAQYYAMSDPLPVFYQQKASRRVWI